jgi:amidohydrolase family protein
MRINRRSFVKLSSLVLGAPAAKGRARSAFASTPPDFGLTSLDQQIWADELAAFVPSRILDVHTHLPCWRFNLDPRKPSHPPEEVGGALFTETTLDLLTRCNQILLPEREIHYLAFASPFPECNFDGSNAHVAKELEKHPTAAGLMLVHPSMSAAHVEKTLDSGRFLGFKCYRFYSTTGDTVECRITDFMPEHQIALADRRGLMIMLHMAKAKACADPENLADLQRLSSKYPRVCWILAHCARSFTPYPIEKAGPQLRQLPNVWIETSAVCESASFSALFEGFGTERVLYGADNPRVGMARGKYSSVGRGWLALDEGMIRFRGPNPTDLRLTFYGYESLRALRYAAGWAKLSKEQIQAIFYDNAAKLIQDVRDHQAY